MKIFQITQIGESHTNHCEDETIVREIGKDKILMAVMDGCTMGKESFFASALIGKLLNKISKELFFKEFIEKKDTPLIALLKEILHALFSELRQLKHQLLLEKEELLSTIVLAVLDIKIGKAESIVIGDGLICCNIETIEYDQNDKPDYIGYHLEEDFETWYNHQNQKASFSDIHDFSISTDGVFSFMNYDNKNYTSIENEGLVNYLLHDNSEIENENMLKKKLIIIEKEWGKKPFDDIGMIRLIK